MSVQRRLAADYHWRLSHGRFAFQGQRHMVGCYLNREDFESRLRLLSSQPMNMVA